MLGLQCSWVFSSFSHLLVLQQKTEHKEVAKHLVFTLPIKQFKHRRVTGLWHIKLCDLLQIRAVIVSPDSFTVSQTGCMKMMFVFLNAAHQWWWKKNVWTNENNMTSLFSLRWVAFQDESYKRKFCRSHYFLRVSGWLKLKLSCDILCYHWQNILWWHKLHSEH